MKPLSRLPVVCQLSVILLALAWWPAASPVQADESAWMGSGILSRPPISVIQGYSSLTQMINRVCEEASTQFYDFFGPAAVSVRPFSVIDEFPARRYSVLGVTLADQMAARINSDGDEQPAVRGSRDQVIEGVIQELDGFLRVHMSGVNARGERRSYVVNVEMSNAVYRALHARVASAE